MAVLTIVLFLIFGIFMLFLSYLLIIAFAYERSHTDAFLLFALIISMFMLWVWWVSIAIEHC